MAVEFINKDVAEHYEPLRSKDGKVHIPADKKGDGDFKGYAGPLSGITAAAAEKSLKSGSNILKKKDGKPEDLKNLSSVTGFPNDDEDNG